MTVGNRWQAFGIHLLVSLVIFFVLMAIILFFWYPGFLFLYDGGLDGVKLIAGVDFFIGPFLTLLVYQVGKKSLRFDLGCIALLQGLCLAGGMWAVWETRPIAIVYANGAFHVTNKQGYENENADPFDVPIVDESRWPVWVGVLQTDRQKYSKMEWAMMAYQLSYSPELYIPYKDVIPLLKEGGFSYALVSEKLGSHYSQKDFPDYVRFYLIITSTSEGLLAVDIRTGDIVKEFF